MIEEIKMWTAVCDNCKTTHELYDGCIAMNEKDYIKDSVKESDEWELTTDGKTYCKDCHTKRWNEEKDVCEIFSADPDCVDSILLGEAV